MKKGKNKNIPVVILCGAMGTRLREETEYKPKPMVEIGGKPVLWHIMKHYAHFGFRRFILCLGYKGSVIKEYFLNLGKGNKMAYQSNHTEQDFNVPTGYFPKPGQTQTSVEYEHCRNNGSYYRAISGRFPEPPGKS